MHFTLYDTIKGTTLAEGATAEQIMERLGMTEEQFWRALSNENYLYKRRYEIVMETVELVKGVKLSTAEQARFADEWKAACMAVVKKIGAKVGWLEE